MPCHPERSACRAVAFGEGGRDLPIEARSTQIIWRDQSPFVRSFTPFRMTKRAVAAAFAMAVIVGSTSVSAQSPQSEITAVLQSQQEAWNRGDIDAFMNGYWRSGETVFVSGDEVTRGWQKVLDRYKQKYSDRAKMGTLAFSDLEITPLGNDAAVALGSWKLKRAQDQPHGRFTLIFRRLPEGWRIVHDHTSAAQ
jgi:ketosteroid isomerase-like protein